MYVFFIILIAIASFLIILSVLAQNPKGGMAANFGASNQVMGVRQTADFLEKFTWGLAISIVVFSLAATMAMPRNQIDKSRDALDQAIQNQSKGIENFQLQNPAPAEGTPAVPAMPATPAEDDHAGHSH